MLVAVALEAQAQMIWGLRQGLLVLAAAAEAETAVLLH